MSDVSKTLASRESQYGAFLANAGAAQLLKFAIHSGANWDKLQSDQKEALEMIASKIGRILTGNFNHIDSWHDIAGYAKLVEDRLNAAVKSRPAAESA